MAKDRIISSYLNLRWLIKPDGSRILQQHILVYNEMDEGMQYSSKLGKRHKEAQEWVDIPEVREKI